jgi:cyclopropane fatty-acyl-phospholipid synthase-like methyltransferase
MNENYKTIVKHYENCLEKFGDTHLGVDWPKLEDVIIRYQVMFELINQNKLSEFSILDFGCGAAHFYDFLIKKNIKFHYAGLDLSNKFISLCRLKFPSEKFICCDILETPEVIGLYDYIILNGVFTEKRELSNDEMFDYFNKVIKILYDKCRIGLAFNVMTKHVDWEREDLFHLAFDKLASFLKQEISKNFIFRNDYGLYEYTTYVFKEPGEWVK